MNPWEEIKSRLNIVDVVGDYIPVRQIGSAYKCVCPFHRDKNPSLILSPEKGLWHCFGCGAGGDLFKFVMDYENISRKQALEKLAKKAGVQLPKLLPQSLQNETENTAEMQTDSEINHEQGLKYLSWVADIYHKILLKILNDRQSPVTRYCLERGLSGELIEKFQLGFAPGKNFLYQLAAKNSLNSDLLFAIGVFKKSDSGQLKDKFSNRLIIPVFDRYGKVVGFTGRTLPPEQSERPKYLNSPQTDWFNKSEIWYGWHLNQKRIRQEKTAIVVEGNMDVITAEKFGLDFCLASQGTSFTTAQLKILKTLTNKVWLAFDNDTAGEISAKKFFKEAIKNGLEVEKLIIPKSYKDLDEFLNGEKLNFLQKNNEMDDKRNLVANSFGLKTMPFVDYIIQQNSNLLKNENLVVQKKAIVEILDLISGSDALTREHYLQKISQISKKSLRALTEELQKTLAGKLNLVPTDREKPDADFDNPKNDQILVTFQNYLSAILAEIGFSRADFLAENKQKFESLFVLLKSLLPKLAEFSDFENFIDQNLEILKLIHQENLQKEIDLNKWWLILRQFINENYGQYLLDPMLLGAYEKLYLTKN